MFVKINKKWNEGKCRCECKELIDKGMCDKGFIWNPRNCECECNKLCDFERLIDKLVEECSENIDGNELLYNETSLNNVILLNTITQLQIQIQCL